MNLKSLAGAGSLTLIFAYLATPALANIVACASGNLSTVDGTTCDIGNLQFTFTGLQGSNSDGIAWTDSEFTLTVLSNGFELSGPPAQTITAPSNGVVVDSAELDFNVTDLTDAIVSLDVFGSDLSVSGDGGVSQAENELYLCNVGCTQALVAYNDVTDQQGAVYDFGGGGPGVVISGYGVATAFSSYAEYGNTASTNGTADFTFTTGPTPPTQVPEPHSLMLLSTA
jgi:hypothetical protein